MKSKESNGHSGNDAPPLKKFKKVENPTEEEIKASFHADLLTSTSQQLLAAQYKHIVIPQLITSDLITAVREEILSNLHFTLKETDIYKLHQTGDLANLSGLSSSDLAHLPSLLQLRNAMYSKPFRDFVCAITGVKALSGTKTDMSISMYEKGGYLLTHDDVIGTRSVSFIFYMVEEGWQNQWGGGLRLYRCSEDGIPENDPSLTIPPAFNQLSLFAVQPGRSFHDVEEVYVDKRRLAISGWFHIPQVGEEHYIPPITSEPDRVVKSSREQLTSSSDDDIWLFSSSNDEHKEDEEGLTEEDINYLIPLMNEYYLTPDGVEQLNASLIEESNIEIPEFLNDKILDDLKNSIYSETPNVLREGWSVAGPPHRHRFLYTRDTKARLGQLSSDLFGHKSFRRWLKLVTGYDFIASRNMARYFRPGMDYTLAQDYTGSEPQIEACLCLTPDSDTDEGWKDDEWGGYEIYMAADESPEEDAAVYNSKQEDEDDGILISRSVGWNSLSLVVRDQGVLRFLKYVSKQAKTGRWDIVGEWRVKGDDGDSE